MRSYFILGFSLLLSIILFTRCEESEPGCLDKNAENFDVQAIDACDTCCILPQVRLDMDLMFDTLPVSLGVDYAFGADTVSQLYLHLHLSEDICRVSIQSSGQSQHPPSRMYVDEGL